MRELVKDERSVDQLLPHRSGVFSSPGATIQPFLFFGGALHVANERRETKRLSDSSYQTTICSSASGHLQLKEKDYT